MGQFGSAWGAMVGMALATCAAAAELPTYYHAGAWDAFSGRDDDGRLICGVGNTNPTDGRRFALRFAIGGEGVTFTASKPTWSIPDQTRATIVMQVGLETPWTEQASGSSRMLSWVLDREATQTFDRQFRRASSMSLTFPDGNEPPWTVPLNGSTAISNAFGRCITDLTARTRNAATPPRLPSEEPTQPFATGGEATAPTANPAGTSSPR